jgi:hypothetical protein
MQENAKPARRPRSDFLKNYAAYEAKAKELLDAGQLVGNADVCRALGTNPCNSLRYRQRFVEQYGDFLEGGWKFKWKAAPPAIPGDGKLYRVRMPRTGFDFLTSAELTSALFAPVVVPKPANPLAYKARWGCVNDDCDAHEVTIRIVRDVCEPGAWTMPRPACPLCGSVMQFEGYLETVTLLPVGNEARG